MSGATPGRVAIAGASGFVGKALVRALVPGREVIALARAVEGQPRAAGVEWRACDLFRLEDAERALVGAEVAVYLVHSMQPAAALTQARFDDLDLICADNFARAAAASGVRHIVYLGGLLPAAGEPLSRHLESRLEVERTLGSHGVPVTTLRAGLIIGAGGSSFEMMARLVGRLPVMLGPRWTRSISQPIDLADAVALLVHAIARPELAGRAYDIAGPDVVSYAELLRMTGRAQGKRTRVLTLPIQTVKLSLLWVSAITGAPQALVRPLVESLRHDMVASDGLVLQAGAGLRARGLQESLAQAVKEQATLDRTSSPKPRARRGGRTKDRRVCSVQRLRTSPTRDARWVADEYVRWLPRFLAPVLRVAVDEQGTCRFSLWPLPRPLLELTPASEPRSGDLRTLYVSGGLLIRKVPEARARLEFRRVLHDGIVLAGVHDFVPRLPWLIYKHTQAVVHLLIMRAFGRHLAGSSGR